MTGGAGSPPAELSPPSHTDAIIGDRQPTYAERAGELMHGAQDDKRKRRAMFRRTAWRKGDDVASTVKDITKTVEQGVPPVRPTGHSTGNGPTISSASQQPVGVPDAVTGVLLSGALIAEAGAWVVRSWLRRKGKHDASD